MPLAATLAQAAAAAGYRPDDPLVIAVGRPGRRPAHLARGCLPTGGAFTVDTRVYAASLAKQVVAACAAVLRLDVDRPVSAYVPEAPPDLRLRHLIHHVGGPPPGTRYAYSNQGYVLLAEAIGRAAGEPLPGLARRLIFEPLGMSSSEFWAGPQPHPPGAAPLDPADPPPLSIGDGGLWTTAPDLLRWAAALDADRLGITGIVQTPGRLDDGTPLDYAWGMGVRKRNGRREYRHGGGYADLRAMLVRVPEQGLDLVVLAMGDRTERRIALTDRLLDALLGLT
jgi:CubicO group peptidase (beta-lactamase class C family)